MEYMLKIDSLYVKDASQYHPHLERYYELMDTYVARILIVACWIRFCYLFRPDCRRRSGDTPKGDRRGDMLFLYALVYGVFSWFSHATLLFYKVFNSLDYPEVCVALRTLFIFFFLTSIFLRTLVLLYVYSRMEFALAGYTYPFENCLFLTVYCTLCVILALCISSIVILTPLPFQAVVDVDRCNLILVSLLVILFLMVLFNDLYRFIGVESRPKPVFLVFIHVMFIAFFYSMYSAYSSIISDMIFNLQIFFIFVLFCPILWYNELKNLPRDLVFLEPLIMFLKNFLVPMPSSSGRSSTTSSQDPDHQPLAYSREYSSYLARSPSIWWDDQETPLEVSVEVPELPSRHPVPGNGVVLYSVPFIMPHHRSDASSSPSSTQTWEEGMLVVPQVTVFHSFDDLQAVVVKSPPNPRTADSGDASVRRYSHGDVASLSHHSDIQREAPFFEGQSSSCPSCYEARCDVHRVPYKKTKEETSAEAILSTSDTEEPPLHFFLPDYANSPETRV